MYSAPVITTSYKLEIMPLQAPDVLGITGSVDQIMRDSEPYVSPGKARDLLVLHENRAILGGEMVRVVFFIFRKLGMRSIFKTMFG